MTVKAVNSQEISINELVQPAHTDEHAALIDVVFDNDRLPRSSGQIEADESFEKPFHIYRFFFYADVDTALQKGVEKLRFSFYNLAQDAQQGKLENAFESFEVSFREDEIVAKTINPAASRPDRRINVRANKNSIKKVFVSTRRAKNLARTKNMLQAPSVEKALTVNASLPAGTIAAKLRNADPAALSAQGTRIVTTGQEANSFAPYSNQSLKSNHLRSNTIIKNKISVAETRNKLARLRLGSHENEVTSAIAGARITSRGELADIYDFTLLQSLTELKFDIALGAIKGASFYYRIDANADDMPGVEKVNPIISAVNHAANRITFRHKAEPPQMRVIASNRRSVTLELRRLDPLVSSFDITRIIENPSYVKPLITTLGKYSFKKAGVMKIVDNNVTNVYPNKVTYRVHSVTNGTITQFSSIVVPNKHVTSAGDVPRISIPVVAVNSDNAIIISTGDIPEEVISATLFRQRYSANGPMSDQITQVGETLSLENQIGTSRHVFADANTILGHRYRYFMTYQTVGELGRTGSRQVMTSPADDIIVRRYPVNALPFDIKISSGITDGITAAFSIATTERAELFQLVIGALNKAGISSQFLGELAANNIKSKEFVAFLVERFDYVTGKRESFEVQEADAQFVDNNDSRSTNGVSAPVPGRRYAYIFKTCIVDPTVFLYESNAELINQSGNTIKKKAKRFSNVIISQLGALPSETEVKGETSIAEQIKLFQVGKEFKFDIEYSDADAAEAKITNVGAYVGSSPLYTPISFMFSNKGVAVSHFNISCDVGNERELLGAVAFVPERKYYLFCDARLVGTVGEKSYLIEAMDFAGRRVDIATYEVTKASSLPTNGLKGVVYGHVDAKKPKVIDSSITTVFEINGSAATSDNLFGFPVRLQLKPDAALESVLPLRKMPNTYVDANAFWQNVELPKFGGS